MTEQHREGHDRMLADGRPGIPLVVTLLVPEQERVYAVTSLIKMRTASNEMAEEVLH